MSFKTLSKLKPGEIAVYDSVELTAINEYTCDGCYFNPADNSICSAPRQLRTSLTPCAPNHVKFVTVETYIKLRIKGEL